MSTELETLQRQLTALNAAKLSNVQSVRFGETQVTFRTAADMIEQITYVERRIAELKRVRSGASRHGFSAARFTGR